LGTFETEIDAAKAYDTYVLLKFGPQAKTNGLIKYEEINVTLDFFERKTVRELPRYISLTTTGYEVQIAYKGKVFRDYYKLLEEAKEGLRKLQEKIDAIKLREEKEHLAMKITRNSDGLAVIDIFKKSTKENIQVIVDADKWHELKRYSWSYEKYVRGYINGKQVDMHRYLVNACEGEIVDHINRNKFDNRIQNLRKTTHTVNMHNKSGTGASNFKGVTFVKLEHKWRATINKDLIIYHLGTYDIEVQAAIAVNIKAKELYGDDACLNEVSEEDMIKHLPIVKAKMKALLEVQEKNKINKKTQVANNLQ